MYSKRFEKEAFKEEVKNNIKNLYRKTIEEATGRQIFQGGIPCGKRDDHRLLAGNPGRDGEEGSEDRVLHVHGIPDGTSARQQPD